MEGAVVRPYRVSVDLLTPAIQIALYNQCSMWLLAIFVVLVIVAVFVLARRESFSNPRWAAASNPSGNFGYYSAVLGRLAWERANDPGRA